MLIIENKANPRADKFVLNLIGFWLGILGSLKKSSLQLGSLYFNFN
jgi:hypothetical protein